MSRELSNDEMTELHDALIRLRESLNGSLSTSREAAATVDLDQPIGRLSRMDALQQQQMAKAQRARLQLRRQQVNAALDAWASGDYGYCRKCDDNISYARLKARPESPFCVPCQSAAEKR